MSEMRNYSKPPQAVHDVLTATLLLLGDHEDATKVGYLIVKPCEPELEALVMNFPNQITSFELHREVGPNAFIIFSRFIYGSSFKKYFFLLEVFPSVCFLIINAHTEENFNSEPWSRNIITIIHDDLAAYMHER